MQTSKDKLQETGENVRTPFHIPWSAIITLSPYLMPTKTDL